MSKIDVIDDLADATAMLKYMSFTLVKILDSGDMPSEKIIFGATKIFGCIEQKLGNVTSAIEGPAKSKKSKQ